MIQDLFCDAVNFLHRGGDWNMAMSQSEPTFEGLFSVNQLLRTNVAQHYSLDDVSASSFLSHVLVLSNASLFLVWRHVKHGLVAVPLHLLLLSAKVTSVHKVKQSFINSSFLKISFIWRQCLNVWTQSANCCWHICCFFLFPKTSGITCYLLLLLLLQQHLCDIVGIMIVIRLI